MSAANITQWAINLPAQSSTGGGELVQMPPPTVYCGGHFPEIPYFSSDQNNISFIWIVEKTSQPTEQK